MTFRTSVIHIKYLQEEIKPDFCELNKYVIKEAGSDVAIIGLGDFYHLGKEVKELLKENGIDATLINPRFITGIDEEVLEKLKENHDRIHRCPCPRRCPMETGTA